MTAPLPSNVRVVRIYRGMQALVTRGLVPYQPLAWPPMHPAETDPSWVDATGWLADIGDTLGQVLPSIVGGDGVLTLGTTYVSIDATRWGICFGGPPTPDVTYVVRVLIYGASTGVSIAVDIELPILDVPAVGAGPGGSGFTVNGQLLTVNGYPLTP